MHPIIGISGFDRSWAVENGVIMWNMVTPMHTYVLKSNETWSCLFSIKYSLSLIHIYIKGVQKIKQNHLFANYNDRSKI